MKARPIKFRAWENGRMYTDLAFITMSHGGMSNKPDTPLIRPLLMQFTGLMDKNGKEIYEGDIVRVREEQDDFDQDEYFVVGYIQEWCRFSLLMKSEYEEYQEQGVGLLDNLLDESYGVFAEESPKYVVVGNVLQHPEVLKR